MPHSDDDRPQVSQPQSEAGQTLAISAEVLYLLNLLLLPGLAFIALLYIYLRYQKQAPPLARCHLRQTLSASLWAGIMLVLVSGVIILLGGFNAPWTWVVVILYFTTIHATLVLLGTMGMARALSGKHYHYPWVGRECTEL